MGFNAAQKRNLPLARVSKGRSRYADSSSLYAPLSIGVVEMRIMRALKTCRAIPDPDSWFWPKFTGARIGWPDVVNNYWEAYEAEMAPEPKFRPTPRDCQDMLPAMEWLRGLKKKEFKLLWWRSLDLSFKQIAINIHRHEETARRWYGDALKKVYRAAINGEK